jgi:predicted RNA binding protein YcfA (HicA-like mRNA interferase family)
LPLEGLLRGSVPFDLRPEDIPSYFVAGGPLADRFFATPSRLEAQRALKHFGYSPLHGRGKGSHEFWTGPDDRKFVLPSRDPLSIGVFGTLLRHLNIDKRTYMNEVRPQL